MEKRTQSYIKRKNALCSISANSDIRSLLKAQFYASKSLVVKKNVLKMYSSLCGKTAQA